MNPEVIIEINKAVIFQKKSLVLSDVSLTVEKGEFIYLVGKTGSGKSSFLKLLYGDLGLREGTASVASFDLSILKNKDIPFLRRKLGIVFQDFQLLNDRSVNDNLLFVLKATGWKNKTEMDERCKEVLQKVGLPTKGYKMPHELSGGEQQRVAIARALLNNPEIILADEPTGNLDPETSEEIVNLLLDICKSGRAILMATHDYSLFKKFPSRMLKFESNKVTDTNTIGV